MSLGLDRTYQESFSWPQTNFTHLTFTTGLKNYLFILSLQNWNISCLYGVTKVLEKGAENMATLFTMLFEMQLDDCQNGSIFSSDKSSRNANVCLSICLCQVGLELLFSMKTSKSFRPLLHHSGSIKLTQEYYRYKSILEHTNAYIKERTHQSSVGAAQYFVLSKKNRDMRESCLVAWEHN